MTVNTTLSCLLKHMTVNTVSAVFSNIWLCILSQQSSPTYDCEYNLNSLLQHMTKNTISAVFSNILLWIPLSAVFSNIWLWIPSHQSSLTFDCEYHLSSLLQHMTVNTVSAVFSNIWLWIPLSAVFSNIWLWISLSAVFSNIWLWIPSEQSSPTYDLEYRLSCLL